MTGAPPLEDGEAILHDHVPSVAAFQRTALLLLALTLPVVAVFLYVFPDTFWPVVPLFVTCIVLMQERVTLGRHRAWITDKRVILQGGSDVTLTDITDIKARKRAVVLWQSGTAPPIKLFYPRDAAELMAVITETKESAI